MLSAGLGLVDPAVLRKRILIRLQAREEFDAAKNAVSHFLRQVRDRGDDAIESKGYLGGFAAHLQMDVAGAGFLGLVNQVVQQLRRENLGHA